MNVIDKIQKDQMDKIIAERSIPDFSAGDTIKVDVKIVEGDKERIQAFEGLCIARSGGGLNESFTVRKISYGEGVERIFPIFSPKIAGITVLKKGKVRRAKLYYLRDRYTIPQMLESFLYHLRQFLHQLLSYHLH